MEIRPETPADRDAIHAVNLRAFGREVEPGLVDAIRASPEFIPELSLVAALDGTVVGHIMLSRIHVDEHPVLTLSPIAVVPEHQRAGIGGRLIAAAVERARARGETLILLVGHPEYYPRFGFVPASRFGITYPDEVRDEVFMALPLVDAAPPRGRLRYPPSFDGVA